MAQRIELTVDEEGRIWIPFAIQDRLGLEPGMTLVVEEGDNGGVRLRPSSERVTLIDKEGILVVQAEPVGDLMAEAGRERDRRVSDLLERTEL